MEERRRGAVKRREEERQVQTFLQRPGVGPRAPVWTLLYCLLLLFSAPPRAPGRGGHGWRQDPGEQPGDPWLLSTSHPDHPPSHSPSWASDSLAVNHPRSLARPPGAPDSLLASCQQPSRSRVLFPPFEVYTYLISLGVIGITRQVAFPLSPSPSLWSAPVFPIGQRNGKRES